MNRQTTVWLVVLFLLLAACASPAPQPTPVAEEVTATPPLCDFHSDQVPSAAAELERTGNPSTNVLAFATGFSASDSDILLTRLDGTSPITLTTHPARDSVPVWSPDGTRIAFTSYRDGGRSVYLMHQDGSGVTPIWHGQGGSWSPIRIKLSLPVRHPNAQ
jgi:dipeptidyl aminopeptidase/acylaminoacyl peptidase